MPDTIKITDQLGVEILSVDPSPFTVFKKYLPGKAGKLVALPALATTFKTPIVAMGPDPVGLGFTLADKAELGEGEVLSFAAGSRFTLNVAQGDAALLRDSLLGVPLEAPPGRAWVALTIAPKLGFGIERPAGDLRLGFKAGTEARWVFAAQADNTDPAVTVGKAAEMTLEQFIVPAEMDDLRQIPPGCVTSVSGQGTLKFSIQGGVAAALNPLASVKLPIVGTASLAPDASVSVGASCMLEGAYEVRAERLDQAKLRLSVYKLRGSEWMVTVKAAASPGGGELLPRLFKAISPDPAANVNALFEGGLSPDQIDRYSIALQQTLNRSLALSVAAEFGGSERDDAAFSYMVDLDALAAEHESLISEALSGNLVPLTSLDDQLPAGIQLLNSRIGDFKRRKLAIKINVLGILNVATFSQLAREGTAVFDNETGELTITDKATWERVAMVAAPMAADGQKLRQVLFESSLITAAYRASGAAANLGFETSLTYFEEHAKTNRQAMKDNLDAVAALELIGYADRDGLLGARASFGRSSMALTLALDDASSRSLFLQASGEPFPVAHYDRLARAALLALVRPEDGTQAVRRQLAASDAIWRGARAEGQAEVAKMFRHLDDVSRANIVGDYTLMVWWADAMFAAAKQVSAMSAFLAQRTDAGRLDRDPEFMRRRQDMSKALAKAIGESRSRFDEPWGLVAMDMASARTGASHATLLARDFKLEKARA